MIPPQEIAVWLDSTHASQCYVQFYRSIQIPNAIEDMPGEMRGRFLTLTDSDARFMATAKKREMIVNKTQVRYSFTFSPKTWEFTATKLQ